MGLFDQVLSAINNPQQQANPDQLGTILNTVQQLTQQTGVDPATHQAILSIVGQHVRSALQQKQSGLGQGQVEQLLNQFGGYNANQDAVQAVFSPNQQQQVIQDVAQKTGISAPMVQSLLPIVVPLILNFLQSGANSSGQAGSNSVLGQFLDSDRDGDVDIGDALSMAGQFINQRR